MKRCIVCGNIGDDSSTVCNVCGNPFGELEYAPENDESAAVEKPEFLSQPVEMPEDAAEPEQPFEMPGRTVVSEEQNAAEDAAVSESENQQPRRMQSGPQIYGQDGQAPDAELYAQQGMIRREVQGRPAQPAAAPVNENVQSVQNIQNRPAQPNRPMNARPVQGQMQGRPMQPQQGRPMNARPMQPQQGRPMNGQMQGRPMPGQMQGRPMPGQMQNRGGRPILPNPSVRAHQTKEAARKMLKSPLWFLIAVFFTANLAASVAAIFMSQLNYAQAAKLISEVSLPAQFSGYVDSVKTILIQLDGGFLGVNLALKVPELLFCLGLWLVFITALAAKERMSGIGFTFMKVELIIDMIFAFLVSLVVLVVAVAVVVAAWVSGATGTMVIAVAALVCIIVIVMMVIMFYFAFLATLKTCRVNADKGESYGKVSRYVGVLHILLALPCVITLLSGIVNNEICGIVGAACQMAWMILFGIWIMMYRGRLEEFNEG